MLHELLMFAGRLLTMSSSGMFLPLSLQLTDEKKQPRYCSHDMSGIPTQVFQFLSVTDTGIMRCLCEFLVFHLTLFQVEHLVYD